MTLIDTIIDRLHVVTGRGDDAIEFAGSIGQAQVNQNAVIDGGNGRDTITGFSNFSGPPKTTLVKDVESIIA